MRDAIGNPIEVGDEVLYAKLSRSGVTFQKAIVIRLTAKMVEVDCIEGRGGWRPPNFLTSGTRIIKYKHGDNIE